MKPRWLKYAALEVREVSIALEKPNGGGLVKQLND